MSGQLETFYSYEPIKAYRNVAIHLTFPKKKGLLRNVVYGRETFLSLIPPYHSEMRFEFKPLFKRTNHSYQLEKWYDYEQCQRCETFGHPYGRLETNTDYGTIVMDGLSIKLDRESCCGFYSFLTMEPALNWAYYQLATVYIGFRQWRRECRYMYIYLPAEVELSGQIVEHEEGYRSTKMRLTRFLFDEFAEYAREKS